MKVRIKFSKSGALVYIGHLDVMRYFQKLFRRACIPVAYSEGFSPHQILSFSPPLPLGMESEGEYADVELTDQMNSDEAVSILLKHSVPEIGIYSFRKLPERCENAMAAVRAARYSVVFDDSGHFDLEDAVKDFNSRIEVPVIKKTKKSEKEINLRPLVYELVADIKENSVEMLISSGSTDNIKPELVIDALFFDKDKDIPNENSLTIKRIDQYTMLDDRLVSLDDIGSDMK